MQSFVKREKKMMNEGFARKSQATTLLTFILSYVFFHDLISI